MALTKEDLLASLCIFKAELREELTGNFKATLDKFQADLNGKISSLQADVNSVGARTLDLEAQMQDLQQKVAPVDSDIASIKAQLHLTTLKCEDLDNRARRDNVRVHGLEEGSEGPDLEAFVVRLFSTLLGEEQSEVQVERVHRVGNRAAGEGRRPRDILVKLSSFKVKERIPLRVRRQDTVSFHGTILHR
ncbi:hypothetical protein NDU88_002614 [Pleurodeles waltl]|uniref:Zinc finger DNA binding protein n=1 Tax=Pleurodeles waltl TaxID=8319 RepID=A0AAV7M242_PLEWA|nr:hypothetical protein NDU88_002614 [Pleurodeles waltl]